MRFTLVIVWIFMLGLFSSYAQQENDTIKKYKIPEQWHFGGGINLSLGNNYSTIGVSPVAMYEITEKVGAGLGLNYIYTRWNRQGVTNNILGGNTFLQYHPIRQLQLLTEFEYNHVVQKNVNQKNTYNVPALYLGAGYSIGKFGAFGVKYDLLWKQNKSIYVEPLVPYFRIYF